MDSIPYDNEAFFAAYGQMARSRLGLAGAGEWADFQKLFPKLAGLRVLDLGCGYGWHCRYCAEHGAKSVLGIDSSAKMLEQAIQLTDHPAVSYKRVSISDYGYPAGCFDLVLSSLALHYVADYREICKKVYQTLVPGGQFLLSVEHPVFTAFGNQDWYYDSSGKILHWPVDHYFEEGPRQAIFLGQAIEKQHRTLTTYVSGLRQAGFHLTSLVEPQPPASMARFQGMENEHRRPMMLLLAARKD